MKQRRRYYYQAASIATVFITAAAHLHHRSAALPFHHPYQSFSRSSTINSPANQKFASPSSLSSTPVKSETFAAVVTAEDRKRRPSRAAVSSNKRRKQKPPLVDSDLLRFLNTTQTLWNTDDANDQCNLDMIFSQNTSGDDMDTTKKAVEVYGSGDGDGNGTAISTVPLALSSVDNKSPVNTVQLRLNSSSFAAGAEIGSDEQMVQEWMKQYECTYIVSRLHQQHGATIEAAYAVGTTIERIAILRAKQKRLRSYCKLRNQIWRRNNISSEVVDTDDTSQKDNELITENSAIKYSESMVEYEEEDVCDIVPFSNDCSNHYNMDEIINVMMEYGLSSKDICEIFMLSPSIAFMQPRPLKASTLSIGTYAESDTNLTTLVNLTVGTQQSLQTILDRVFVGLLMGSNQPYELKLRKYDARKVLRNTPGILTARGSESAHQIIQLLINLGVSTNSLSRDKNNLPILLSRQPNDVFRIVAFLSSDAVRMPITKIGPLLRRTEGQDLLNAIAPSRAHMIGQQRRMIEPTKQKFATANIYALYNGLIRGANGKNTSPSYVATQIQKVIVDDIYRRMSETAWTLRNKIGTSDLGRVIAAYPSVLLLDASRQILPTAQYLMDELDILPNDLPSILQLYPALLRTDVEQMRTVVSYLTSIAVAEDNLGTIFRSFPVLLTLDIEHDMEPVVTFLQSIGVSNVGRFISRLPPILGYSVENELRPKFEYLNSISSDARFKITKFPAYFSYPLERVIKSRFEYLRKAKRIPTPLLSLDHILCSGDKDFAMKVCQDVNVTQYAQFIQDRQEDIRTNSMNLGRQASDESTKEQEKELTQRTQQSNDALNPKNSNRNKKPITNTNSSTDHNEQTSFPPGVAAIPS